MMMMMTALIQYLCITNHSVNDRSFYFFFSLMLQVKQLKMDKKVKSCKSLTKICDWKHRGEQVCVFSVAHYRQDLLWWQQSQQQMTNNMSGVISLAWRCCSFSGL